MDIRWWSSSFVNNTKIKMAFEKFDLTGKNALITGAAGLLGNEHASALLESGAKVILTDINLVELELVKAKLTKQFAESKIYLKIMDVTNVQAVGDVAKKLSEENINIDILINNAAVDPKVQENNGLLENSRFENFTIEQWDLQLDVGLKGAFICSQIFGTKMVNKGNGGVIVNIASDLSIISPDQRLYREKGLKEDKQPVKPVTY
jgi:NAD(P)-dependent dehydrogenase (short-subunit alcohol dehydrogenase family)